jgi:hypothetical protein
LKLLLFLSRFCFLEAWLLGEDLEIIKQVLDRVEEGRFL